MILQSVAWVACLAGAGVFPLFPYRFSFGSRPCCNPISHSYMHRSRSRDAASSWARDECYGAPSVQRSTRFGLLWLSSTYGSGGRWLQCNELDTHWCVTSLVWHAVRRKKRCLPSALAMHFAFNHSPWTIGQILWLLDPDDLCVYSDFEGWCLRYRFFLGSRSSWNLSPWMVPKARQLFGFHSF